MKFAVEDSRIVVYLDCGVRCNPVSLYLCSSYTYKEAFGYILEDEEYDTLCKAIVKYKDRPEISEHPHFNLLNIEAMKSSTGWFGMRYTNKIKGSAVQLLKIVKDVRNQND